MLNSIAKLHFCLPKTARLSHLRGRDRGPARAQHRVQQPERSPGRDVLLGRARDDHHAGRTLPSTPSGSLEIRLRRQHHLRADPHLRSISIAKRCKVNCQIKYECGIIVSVGKYLHRF